MPPQKYNFNTSAFIKKINLEFTDLSLAYLCTFSQSMVILTHFKGNQKNFNNMLTS